MKTAILVVSFGTTHMDALTDAIERIESTIQERMAPLPVFRAFTSSRVISVLKTQHQLEVPKPLEAIQALAKEGYTRILIQPLHVIPGFEFDKLQRDVRIAGHDRELTLELGRPLLSQYQDYLTFIEAMESESAHFATTEGVLWMGHGTDHAANACYVYLERLWQQRRANVHIVNIDGYPELHHIFPTLKSRYQQLDLCPLLIVAGDHAKNDMAGEEDSLKTALAAEGIQVSLMLRGLGSFESVANLFADRVEALYRGEEETA